MADTERDPRADHIPEDGNGEPVDVERDDIRGSNDRGEESGREGAQAGRKRSFDEGARGQSADVDPDSAEAGVDRDDTIDEP